MAVLALRVRIQGYLGVSFTGGEDIWCRGDSWEAILRVEVRISGGMDKFVIKFNTFGCTRKPLQKRRQCLLNRSLRG